MRLALYPIGDDVQILADHCVEPARRGDNALRHLHRADGWPLMRQGQLGQKHGLRVGRRALQPLACGEPFRSGGAQQLERRVIRPLLRGREITCGLRTQTPGSRDDLRLIVALAADRGEPCHGAKS